MAEERYSFESGQTPANVEKTVKLNPKKSKFAPQFEARQAAEQLDRAASEIHQKSQDRQQEIFELGSRFVEMMKDRTVPTQKGPVAQSVEREVLQQLINFAIEVNTDLNEPKEGMGSVSLLTLMLKVSLLMRDKHNVLEHKIHQLEQRLLQLESQPKPSSDTPKTHEQ
jgi:cell division protein ZapA (FtsZ GTPase activity inhibitor)